eukprot:137835_1
MCAIKIMDKDRAIIDQLYAREINILQKLTPDLSNPHRGILPFIGHGEDSDSFYIVTRLMRGGELFERIVSKTEKYKITEKVAVKLVLNMLESVKYCHDHNIVHRDLKPENFVFASTRVDSDIVLIDYGCALHVQDDEVVDDVVGTAYYLAPELAVAALANYRKQGRSVSRKIGEPKPRTGRILKAADVWGMGVIAYVMMTGRAPFRGRDNMRIFESTVLKTLFFPDKDARYHNKLKLSDHFKDFIRKALIKDPLKRISIEDAIRHPWVQGMEASDYRLNSDVIHYLRQFKYQSKLKKEITRVLAANMTDEPTKQVRAHFRRLDENDDGVLNEAELSNLLLFMGYGTHAAKSESKKVMEHADRNQDGVIDFEEFKQMWYRKVLCTNDQYIHRVFDVLDDNEDGHIDAHELKAILTDKDESAGDAAPDVEEAKEEAPLNEDGDADGQEEEKEEDEDEPFLETVQKMIREVDADGDGLIDFDEFKSAMKEVIFGDPKDDNKTVEQ